MVVVLWRQDVLSLTYTPTLQDMFLQEKPVHAVLQGLRWSCICAQTLTSVHTLKQIPLCVSHSLFFGTGLEEQQH